MCYDMQISDVSRTHKENRDKGLNIEDMIGCTVSTIGGLIRGIERAATQGYQCTQIYTTNSRTWKVSCANYENVQEYSKQYGIRLIGHVPFIVNLASRDNSVREKSVKRLAQEIVCAHKCGINVLVIHPGSTLDGDVNRGIDCIIRAVCGVYDMCVEYNIVLALETMSGQGTQIGSTFEELMSIIQGSVHNSHLAVCLDTCHIYAAGYQIERWNHLNNILTEFDKIIGMERMKVIHLNNTKTGRGKRTDRHSSIFDGNICLETFEKLVVDERFERIPIIIEPPAKDSTGAEQVKYLQKKRMEIKGYEG